MTPSSFPRSGASADTRANQSHSRSNRTSWAFGARPALGIGRPIRTYSQVSDGFESEHRRSPRMANGCQKLPSTRENVVNPTTGGGYGTMFEPLLGLLTRGYVAIGAGRAS